MKLAQPGRAFASDVPALGETNETSRNGYQAYRILQAAFVIAPIVAGLDKFLHLLVDWDKYLPPLVNNMTGGRGHQLMLVVGVIEIVAGIGVAVEPPKFFFVFGGGGFFIIFYIPFLTGYFFLSF